jgi:hypothetical protein
MKIRCAHCGKASDKSAGHVNRAKAAGLRLYCDRRCAGLGRRKHIPKSVLRFKKKLYDAEYRKKNLARIKANKREYFQRTYDPAKAAIERKKTMPRHVEYCRRPEYKRWKSEYDRKRRDAEFGPWAEAARLCIDLSRATREVMTDEEIRQANGTFNKTQKRRREGKDGERSRPRNRFRCRRYGHPAAYG